MTKTQQEKKMNEAIEKAGCILHDAWEKCGLTDTSLIFAPVYAHPRVYLLKFHPYPEKKIEEEYKAEAKRRKKIKADAKSKQ